MSRKTLVEQVCEMEFSEEAAALVVQLGQFGATDECGLVVLVAAATLLAGECPGETAASACALNRLSDEFGDLAFWMHGEREKRRQPSASLRVVGGTDMIGGAA